MNNRDLARRLSEASSVERREILRRYCAWVFQGTKAQGWYSAGFVLSGVSLFVALDLLITGLRNPLAYMLSGIGLFVGAQLLSVAVRRERDWRRDHPLEG